MLRKQDAHKLLCQLQSSRYDAECSLCAICCSTTAPAVDRIRPAPQLTLAQPSPPPGGLPPWWEPAHREQRAAGEQAEPAGTSPAAAAAKAATLLRVIVNVRITGRVPKARIFL